ncbi:hypothetical protein B0H12DRAFT_1078943 [Mycena haematopus]|nr:hypothetical protein B0H12DRAFT_1078943 [Mycena haematopus]
MCRSDHFPNAVNIHVRQYYTLLLRPSLQFMSLLTDPGSSDLNTSEEERRIERGRVRQRGRYADYERQKAEYEKWVKEEEALQSKRDQWKAASARYYQRHPEVKEKKRLKAAERRAAKKLARRKWDPPKKKKAKDSGKGEPDDDDDNTEPPIGLERLPLPPDPRPPRVQKRTREAQQLGDFSQHPDINLSADERDGYSSQIFDVFHSWEDFAGAGWSRADANDDAAALEYASPEADANAAVEASSSGLRMESIVLCPAEWPLLTTEQSPTDAAHGTLGSPELARRLGSASSGIQQQLMEPTQAMRNVDAVVLGPQLSCISRKRASGVGMMLVTFRGTNRKGTEIVDD